MIDLQYLQYAMRLWPQPQPRDSEGQRRPPSPWLQTLSLVWYLITFMGMMNSVLLVTALVYYTGQPAVIGALCL
jgi:hypothetical protein